MEENKFKELLLAIDTINNMVNKNPQMFLEQESGKRYAAITMYQEPEKVQDAIKVIEDFL